jgi:hypothetical protein
MPNLLERISCYVIASISCYRMATVASTWVVVARTRACCRLSAAGFAGMAATGRRGKSEAVADQELQLATERHRLAKIGQECVSGAAALIHSPIL